MFLWGRAEGTEDPYPISSTRAMIPFTHEIFELPGTIGNSYSLFPIGSSTTRQNDNLAKIQGKIPGRGFVIFLIYRPHQHFQKRRGRRGLDAWGQLHPQRPMHRPPHFPRLSAPRHPLAKVFYWEDLQGQAGHRESGLRVAAGAEPEPVRHRMRGERRFLSTLGMGLHEQHVRYLGAVSG